MGDQLLPLPLTERSAHLCVDMQRIFSAEGPWECLDLRLLELMPPLAALCPPATVIDKTRYSALAEPRLAEHLREREADALIVSGSETDVCVLATVLDAVDIGYRVIVVRDAVCSSSDEGHNILMRLYHARYTEQIETADAATILTRWE
jgi:nicotinamidase-related amidase